MLGITQISCDEVSFFSRFCAYSRHLIALSEVSSLRPVDRAKLQCQVG